MRVFNETQKFTQWWLWLILLATTLAVVSKPMLTWVQSNFEDNSGFEGGFWIGIATLLLVVVLFLLFKLTLTINERGISYQFFPIHLKPKLLKWEQLANIGTRTYKPLIEYGGWGYRSGTKGKALNIKGNKGIQIKLKNGSSLLIGTQKMEDAQKVINRYFKKDEGI